MRRSSKHSGKRSGQPSQRASGGSKRPIVWLALLLSLAALVLSTIAFCLTWDDGRLADNARRLWGDLDAAVEAKRARSREKALHPALPDQGEDTRPNSKFWERLRAQLDRAEDLVRRQDTRRARVELDRINRELMALRDRTAETTGRWSDTTLERLRAVRERIAVDGPKTIETLQSVAGEVGDLADKARRREADENEPETPDEDE